MELKYNIACEQAHQYSAVRSLFGIAAPLSKPCLITFFSFVHFLSLPASISELAVFR